MARSVTFKYSSANSRIALRYQRASVFFTTANSEMLNCGANTISVLLDNSGLDKHRLDSPFQLLFSLCYWIFTLTVNISLFKLTGLLPKKKRLQNVNSAS